MQRLKIVQCLFTFEMGGAQVLALELLNEMCKEHDVFLIVINNAYNKNLLKLLDKRVQLHFINRKEGTRNPIPIIKFNLLLYKINPDIIHCHEPNVAKIIKYRNAKTLYTIHDVGIATSYYHMFDMLVAISNAVFNDVRSGSHLPVKIVHNGIPMDLFNIRTRYALVKGQPVKLVQLSRLMHEKKGQDILLRALSKVLNEYGFRDLTLDFIGSGHSYDYLVKLTKELGLENHVNFIGEKDRDWLFSNLSQYHLLIQPSRYEGFGLTILEGFAAGLPVLASNIDGPAEVIKNLPAGFLFENENIDGCSKKLMSIFKIYENDEMGELMNSTIPIIKQKYSMKTCVKDYLEEYYQLIGVTSRELNII
ncbi:MAG: glycosyltransferase [Chitinophagaceae bacterium]